MFNSTVLFCKSALEGSNSFNESIIFVYSKDNFTRQNIQVKAFNMLFLLTGVVLCTSFPTFLVGYLHGAEFAPEHYFRKVNTKYLSEKNIFC